MKKLSLPAFIVAMLGASMASAYTLTVNDVTIPNWEGASFTFDDGALTLTTAGYTGPVDPGPVDPGPVDPGPVDPGPVDPGPVDPGPGPVDPCDDLPSGVICGKAFSDDALAKGPDELFPIKIPKGKTHASKLIAAGPLNAYGKIRWYSPSYADQYAATAWISSTPGGAPVGLNCEDSGASIIEIAYAYQASGYTRCVLTKGERYFANIKYNSDNVTSTLMQQAATSIYK